MLEKVNARYVYDKETGLITRKVDFGTRWKAGQICGSKTHQGYIELKIDGKMYGAHRIAWMLHYQTEPPEFVDHKDRDGTNNRIDNLRAATKSQNGANRTALANNTYGFKGCYRVGDKWRVQCRVDKKLFNLGYFEDIENARKAYNKFAASKFGEFSVNS
jgi:hypothetical protein